MEFVIKPRNKIEYKTRKKLLHGSFTVKNISICLTSDDPFDLSILSMHKGLIEKAIIDKLNKKFYFDE